jgi:hypothetical protein
MPNSPRRLLLRPRRDDFALDDLRLAEVLRLLGTTRSSSLTERPAEGFARGDPSKLGSMRPSVRFAMRCAVYPDAYGARGEE